MRLKYQNLQVVNRRLFGGIFGNEKGEKKIVKNIIGGEVIMSVVLDHEHDPLGVNMASE